MDVIVLYPNNETSDDPSRLESYLFDDLSEVFNHVTYYRNATDLASNLDSLHHKRLLLVVHLGQSGLNSMLYQMICVLRSHPNCLVNSIGSVIVDGQHELYTKETGRQIVFTMNQAGCTFPGRPLVEATGSLHNYKIQANIHHLSLLEAYQKSAKELLINLRDFNLPTFSKPNLLCIHANSHVSSNTYAVWSKVKEQLEPDIIIKEFNARNGEIIDCSGCPFKVCMHFSEQGKCFYGGTMIEEAYPAVEACDGMIVLAPNYNDALSANITAFINRLTALYRTVSFKDKYLFAIIISGYSGGDIVANQMISALNMNKQFILPGEFALFETANNPNTVFKQDGINEKIDAYASRIREYMLH